MAVFASPWLLSPTYSVLNTQKIKTIFVYPQNFDYPDWLATTELYLLDEISQLSKDTGVQKALLNKLRGAVYYFPCSSFKWRVFIPLR